MIDSDCLKCWVEDSETPSGLGISDWLLPTPLGWGSRGMYTRYLSWAASHFSLRIFLCVDCQMIESVTESLSTLLSYWFTSQGKITLRHYVKWMEWFSYKLLLSRNRGSETTLMDVIIFLLPDIWFFYWGKEIPPAGLVIFHVYKV